MLVSKILKSVKTVNYMNLKLKPVFFSTIEDDQCNIPLLSLMKLEKINWIHSTDFKL